VFAIRMPETWFILIALVLAGIVAAAAVTSLVPAAIVKRRLQSQLRDATRGRVAITFDDGPGPSLTPPLLDLLRSHAAKASFFLVGFRAVRHPEAIDLMAAAGHELGNHTHWHQNAWRRLPWTGVRDVHQGYATLSRWMQGNAPFRPPFGKLTTWSMLTARRRGAAICFWTHDGGDTWPTLPDPWTISQSVVASRGGVVLLHSHDRGQERERYVLAVTEQILLAARDHGLRVCTMSEIMNVATAGTAARSQHAAAAGAEV
jgi:peptidoglycan-N-acetylglucosamine deacetylase